MMSHWAAWRSTLISEVAAGIDARVLTERPVAAGEDRFDSERVGLDHVSFTVGSRDELVQAVQRLEEHGVAHGEVNDLTDFGIAILSFSDPDGVHLELTAAL